MKKTSSIYERTSIRFTDWSHEQPFLLQKEVKPDLWISTDEGDRSQVVPAYYHIIFGGLSLWGPVKEAGRKIKARNRNLQAE